MPGESGTIGNVVKSATLTEMAMGYCRSRVLCAAARLGLADALGDGERTVDEVAASCAADPAALRRLLRALASFGVVTETAPSRFVLTTMGRPLRKDVPNSEWASVVFWSDLLADSWGYLTESVRTGDAAMRVMEREGVRSLWSADPDARAIFGAVMGTAPAEAYMAIARAWDFSPYATVADLGGGGGGLIIAVMRAFPGLRGLLVDREDYVQAARPRFEKEGLLSRCQLVGADLTRKVPPGADVYLLKHVLHGFDDGSAIEILEQCRQVVPCGGRLLVIEFVLPDVVCEANEGLEARLMSDLNMLVVTGGKERSAPEWKALLDRAGFDCERVIPVPGDLVSIIEAAPRG